MNWTSKLLAALPLALCVGCASSYADRQPQPFAGAHGTQAQIQPVSVTLERPGGTEYPSFLFAGAQWVAGQEGDRYNLRLQNHTHERVEAVVTVDGRDVISGELGNYKRQRGYVIEPFSSVVVEGFRVSLDHVAAFRFTTVGESYSAARGSGEHAGVIGVAVFREKERRAKNQAFAPRPGNVTVHRPSAAPEPFGAGDDEAGADRSASVAQDPQGAPPSSAPSAEADFAQPPQPINELGTEFGETTHSAVSQVEFKRKRKRKPDAIITMFYDSAEGLRARGVPVGPARAVAPKF